MAMQQTALRSGILLISLLSARPPLLSFIVWSLACGRFDKRASVDPPKCA
jgi:hypothetical protein